jgi:CBS domain-containing protein
MVAATTPLHALTARDLMSCDLVTIPLEMSLRSAARLLSRNQISGAPVVDAAGRCVGVLTATDFLQCAGRGGEAARPARSAPCFCSDWQVPDADTLPADSVAAYMTPDPVLVTPGTRLGQLARSMLDAHIHRVIVANADRQPLGIVTSMDVLAAVARTDLESDPLWSR